MRAHTTQRMQDSAAFCSAVAAAWGDGESAAIKTHTAAFYEREAACDAREQGTGGSGT